MTKSDFSPLEDPPAKIQAFEQVHTEASPLDRVWKEVCSISEAFESAWRGETSQQRTQAMFTIMGAANSISTESARVIERATTLGEVEAAKDALERLEKCSSVVIDLLQRRRSAGATDETAWNDARRAFHDVSNRVFGLMSIPSLLPKQTRVVVEVDGDGRVNQREFPMSAESRSEIGGRPSTPEGSGKARSNSTGQAIARVRGILTGRFPDKVYPGKLIVSLTGANYSAAVDDELLDSSACKPIGVALGWPSKGPLPPPCVAVEADGVLSGWVAIHAADSLQPSTGNLRIDGWLLRAAAVEYLAAGRFRQFGGPLVGVLNPAELTLCIAAILRQRAFELLHLAPEHVQLPQLAAVVNMENPDTATILAAKTELVALAPKWKKLVSLTDGGAQSGCLSTAKPLKPSVRKAGEALERASREQPHLAPMAGEAPSERCWEWISEHCYNKNCPEYDTFCRYIREYNKADVPNSKLPGRRVEQTGSMIRAKDEPRK